MSDDSASSVAIRCLSCGYAERTVLRQVDLDLSWGRTICLLGPGGAGKSTLLRILADRVPQGDGFWLDGDLKRGGLLSTGYLSQRLLDEARSLLDLLGERGLALKRAEEAALEVWSEVPAARQLILSTLDMPLRCLPAPLSRFVGFTAVVADLPEFVLLDEPDAEMDDELRGWIQDALLQIRGRCIVALTTHHLRLARKVSDFCALFDSGRLVEHGPTEDLFLRSQNERTRRFVAMGS